MNGSILVIRSRTAGTSAFPSRFWKPCGHRRQPAPRRLVALRHLCATTTKNGRMRRLANACLRPSTSPRLASCRRGFPSRITRPKRRCARSAPTARSNGKATSSTFAARLPVKPLPSRRPRTDTGKCASSTCRSASSTKKHASCGAALAQRRSGPNHEQLSPIHPLYSVTHPSAGQRDMQDQTLPTVAESAMRGLACKCPRCGKGKLYAGFLDLRPNCESCGLDYAFIDPGDGSAIFLIMIAGALVVGSALIVEIKSQPPFWLHAALWLPLILATTLLPMRSMKSLLIALQFHHKAAPGRLIDRESK